MIGGSNDLVTQSTSDPARALQQFLIVMGIRYLMASSYLFLVDIEPHQQAGKGIVEGISIKYHGSTSGSWLEAALKRTMADKLTARSASMASL